ncbi:MAG: orotidine-5'-phosphate decarboxylase [Sporanaerobacter sp.]|uniref:orotidine-5'-phosphate decarboxylase n=1 Tax=Sporanaerobacter sp. TaxID=2010183 RepID=UPI003A101AC3
MIIDRLYEEVRKKGNVCVGLDTCLDYVPDNMMDRNVSVEDILFQFNKRVIDATIDIVPCYKVQIAFYEAYGLKGMSAYKKTLKYIRDNGSIVIADIKRGDISSTAQMYAKAHFEGDFESDIITLNPYMGFDSIIPYLDYVEKKDKGLFILLRTSNDGAKDIQYLNVNGNEKLYNHVGDKLKEIALKYMGRCGYSSIGAVVGGTHLEEAEEIRNRLDNMFFLIPGYGAQGGKGSDVAHYLKNGNGGVVNSSRGIITAYKKYEDGIEKFDEYIRKAVLNMKEDISSGSKVL